MSVLCVVAAGLLGLSVARWMERRGASRAACIATIAFSMVNPLTREALVLGHPEELLAGALCVGAVLAALRGRSARAALLLGLAAAACAPFVAGNLSRDGLADRCARAAAVGSVVVLPPSHPRRRAGAARIAVPGALPRRPGRQRIHHVPFLLSLLAWEGLVRRRLPLVSILTSATIPFAIGSDFYLAAILPVATWLAVTLYLPRRIVARSPRASAGRSRRRPGPPGRRPNLQSVA